MNAKYICPAQIRKNIHPFLMCELLKKDNVDYNLRENALTIACPNQHYCPCTKRPENTAEYKVCYDNLKAPKEIPAPIVEEEQTVEETQTEETVKPKRRKAKTDNEL